MKKNTVCFLLVWLIFLVTPVVHADTLLWTNQAYLTGTGFGNVTNVLSLQVNPRQGPTEIGSVIPTSVPQGHATNTSKTWTSAQLAALGFNDSNLGIVWNVNQTGASPEIILNFFSIDFFDASGAPRGSADLEGTGYVKGAVGTGTSGWLISYNNTGLLKEFFANPGWVLGGTGSAGNATYPANDGQDNFYLTRIDVPPPPPQVPEPITLILLGFGVVGLAGLRRSKKA